MTFGDEEDLLFTLNGALCRLVLQEHSVRAWVAADERKQVDAALAAILVAFPTTKPDEESRVLPFEFWFFDDQAKHRTRQIEVPSWRDISRNYAESTRRDVEATLGAFPSESSGGLILWHGPPGTGKTWAVRGLAWEWRKWCSLHFILDPESLFGHRPGYLLEVASEMKERKVPWRLLVLEDAGEFLTPDARVGVGQALSRVLNLGDGVLGQGLRVIVLVTSNEPISRLHPAISRPGRCAAEVAFEPLGAVEADRWLEQRGEAPRGKPQTIAELHRRGKGPQQGSVRPQVGFAPIG